MSSDGKFTRSVATERMPSDVVNLAERCERNNTKVLHLLLSDDTQNIAGSKTDHQPRRRIQKKLKRTGPTPW